jgi:hypothetical protein
MNRGVSPRKKAHEMQRRMQQCQNGRPRGAAATERSKYYVTLSVGLYYVMFVNFKLLLICDNDPKDRNSVGGGAPSERSLLGNGNDEERREEESAQGRSNTRCSGGNSNFEIFARLAVS